jgi:thiol-disulfide isomerase/thioredoxin
LFRGPEVLGSTGTSQQVSVKDFLYNLFKPVKVVEKANRLLVITEPSWCRPCRELDPHLKQLKKEGYDVYEYTLAQWKKAKPKPANLPKGVSASVPTVLYVVANDKENKVVRSHNGGKEVTAEYIKRYLTK